MKLFVKCKRNGGDCYMGFENQDEATVTAMLTDLGATDIEFITEEQWNTLVEEMRI